MADENLKLQVLFNYIDNATKPLKAIIAGNRDMAKSLKQSRDQLKDLGKVQKDVSAFRDLRNGLTGTASELAGAQAKVKRLAEEMKASASPTKAMVRDFNSAQNAAARLKEAHQQQQTQLQTLRTRLAGAGVDTRNLSQHERQLRANVEEANASIAKQQARLAELAARERKLAQAREKMKALQDASARMAGTGARAIGAGAATASPVLASVSAYAKAEDSATQLKVALMGAGATVPPEFQKINDLAMKLGDRLPGATADFQDMMTMLVRQGMPAKSILGGLGEATALLAVQLKKPPAEAAEFASKLQDATRTAEGDMLGLMDVIQKSFYLGVDDNNMLEGFAKMSPALDIIKKKGLEGAKALAPLLILADQAGMRGEAAGNAYRKVFQLSMDASKVAKASKGAGVKLDFTNGKGEFGGLDKMFAQLDKLKGLSTQKRLSVIKTIFGDDAETLQAVTLMIDKGAAGYAEVQAKMAAQATLQERVNTQLGTLKNLWDAATGTFTNGLVAFGEAISPELHALTTWLGDMAQGMSAWARENPRTAAAIMKTIAALALLLTVGGAITLMLASVLGPLAIVRFSMTALGMQGGILARVLGFGATALRMVGMAIMFIGRALLMNPIGLLITAIAGAAFLIYKYWGPITTFFSGLWEGIKSAFSAAIVWFMALPNTFATFGANLISGLINGITNGLGAVKDAITNVASSTIGWFKEKLGIHSPSRVFGELGGYISQGAALGMEGEQNRVAKAASSLALVATTAFGAPGIATAAATPFLPPGTKIDARAPISAPQAASSPVYGGDTIQIIIQGANQDPQAIAKAVEAALDRRDRAKRARAGSSLSDK